MNKRNSILIVHEDVVSTTIRDFLEMNGFSTVSIDPTIASKESTREYYFSGLIYEPWFAIEEYVGPMEKLTRPFYDRLINQAIRQDAKLIALSRVSEEEAKRGGFIRGVDYTHFIEIPSPLQGLLDILKD